MQLADPDWQLARIAGIYDYSYQRLLRRGPVETGNPHADLIDLRASLVAPVVREHSESQEQR